MHIKAVTQSAEHTRVPRVWMNSSLPTSCSVDSGAGGNVVLLQAGYQGYGRPTSHSFLSGVHFIIITRYLRFFPTAWKQQAVHPFQAWGLALPQGILFHSQQPHLHS